MNTTRILSAVVISTLAMALTLVAPLSAATEHDSAPPYNNSFPFTIRHSAPAPSGTTNLPVVTDPRMLGASIVEAGEERGASIGSTIESGSEWVYLDWTPDYSNVIGTLALDKSSSVVVGSAPRDQGAILKLQKGRLQFFANSNESWEASPKSRIDTAFGSVSVPVGFVGSIWVLERGVAIRQESGPPPSITNRRGSFTLSTELGAGSNDAEIVFGANTLPVTIPLNYENAGIAGIAGMLSLFLLDENPIGAASPSASGEPATPPPVVASQGAVRFLGSDSGTIVREDCADGNCFQPLGEVLGDSIQATCEGTDCDSWAALVRGEISELVCEAQACSTRLEDVVAAASESVCSEYDCSAMIDPVRLEARNAGGDAGLSPIDSGLRLENLPRPSPDSFFFSLGYANTELGWATAFERVFGADRDLFSVGEQRSATGDLAVLAGAGAAPPIGGAAPPPSPAGGAGLFYAFPYVSFLPTAEADGFLTDAAAGNDFSLDAATNALTGFSHSGGSCSPCVLSSIVGVTNLGGSVTHGANFGTVLLPYTFSRPAVLAVSDPLQYIALASVTPRSALPGAGTGTFSLVPGTGFANSAVHGVGVVDTASFSVNFPTSTVVSASISGHFGIETFSANSGASTYAIQANGTFRGSINGTCSVCGLSPLFGQVVAGFASGGAAIGASYGFFSGTDTVTATAVSAQ